MRVVPKRSLIDRITDAMAAIHANNDEVSHIELTERELQQLHHECGMDPMRLYHLYDGPGEHGPRWRITGDPFQSDAIYETRFLGVPVRVV